MLMVPRADSKSFGEITIGVQAPLMPRVYAHQLQPELDVLARRRRLSGVWRAARCDSIARLEYNAIPLPCGNADHPHVHRFRITFEKPSFPNGPVRRVTRSNKRGAAVAACLAGELHGDRIQTFRTLPKQIARTLLWVVQRRLKRAVQLQAAAFGSNFANAEDGELVKTLRCCSTHAVSYPAA